MPRLVRDAQAGVAPAIEELETAPPLTDDELFYWRAWEEMGSDRPASMGGMLPIPLTAIISFADYADLSPRETDYLVQVTRAVDNRMLVLIAEKRAKKQSKTTIE